jgi:L-xylulose reductase
MGMEFEGKTVLVTGAGKGIGRATAKLLAARGASVVALTRTKEDLDSLEREIGCRSIVVDLADADATRRAAIEALPADLLVNNAGTTTLEPFLDVSVEAFDFQYAVNTRAPMIVAQEYARDRIRRGLPGPSSTCRRWPPSSASRTMPAIARRRARSTVSRGSWPMNSGVTASGSMQSIRR